MFLPTIAEVKLLNKAQLKELIDQLEVGMKDLLDNKEVARYCQMNILIGYCIDLFNQN